MTTSAPPVDTAIEKVPNPRVGPFRLRDSFLRAVKQSKDDDVSGMAAELAYRSALAILPFLLVVAALPSVVGSIFSIPDLGDQLIREAESTFSKNSAAMIRTIIEEVDRSKGWTPLISGLVGATWTGTMAIASLRKTLNRIYKYDDKASMIRRVLTEVGLTLAAGSLFFTGLVLILLGHVILDGEVGQLATSLLALAAVFTAVTLLYWLAPAGDNQFRWVTPGAVFFCLAWLVFSFGFSIYLSRFGEINRVYGSLGAMLAMLIWLYGSNAALLLGAELNAIVGEKLDPEVNRQMQAD